ncbi:adenylate kinase [Acidipropionibacterium acidipropionici]|uniref:Adenylate kinase n=2 Tax=Acidipropionibacterium acidipropionici TaxID=1748 RepID=A0AAC8YE93_9ACTN|nr:adenylate kinase [Acidipropionibacterium acidipropionici]AOZ46362.1 adenylate kinase [Acidipropionibacterium acidipropionici]AZP37596.1 adenylate kinase [Acidipropionibacterium acidipropionici]
MVGMPTATASDLGRARRVLIHGATGSGKSTAAARIGRILDLPVHLADEEIGFLPASQAVWTNRPAEEMRRIAGSIAAEERWVLDSSYGAFRDQVLSRADVVIGLDYPRWLSLARLLRRTAGRIRDGRLVCNGNRETLREQLSRDSIIVWHFTSFARKRATMRAWAADPAGPPTILVSGLAELERLIAAIS